MIWLIIFWVCVAAMFHSYVAYPILLRLLASNKQNNTQTYTLNDGELPFVYIIFSVFNEEKVIAEKLQSVLNSSYPKSKFKIVIGSDNSSDKSNEIIENYVAKYPGQIAFRAFTNRNGKSGVLNRLTAELFQDTKTQEAIFVLTDANVFFTQSTLFELVKHFKNESIGQVAANILNKGERADGISHQEKGYVSLENKIKYYEGVNWGTMMGAFGACHAIRARFWQAIPPNHLMEDFYLSMNILTSGYNAICELNAICYEDVSNEMQEEFKRKTRIQAGNIQNLQHYWKAALRPDALAFSFWSHKIIRWLGPIFILLALVSNIMLLNFSTFYAISLTIQIALLLSPLADIILRKINIHIKLLRFASYFYMMNLALAKGMWMFARGIKTNVWNPTKRNI